MPPPMTAARPSRRTLRGRMVGCPMVLLRWQGTRACPVDSMIGSPLGALSRVGFGLRPEPSPAGFLSHTQHGAKIFSWEGDRWSCIRSSVSNAGCPKGEASLFDDVLRVSGIETVGVPRSAPNRRAQREPPAADRYPDRSAAGPWPWIKDDDPVRSTVLQTRLPATRRAAERQAVPPAPRLPFSRLRHPKRAHPDPTPCPQHNEARPPQGPARSTDSYHRPPEANRCYQAAARSRTLGCPLVRSIVAPRPSRNLLSHRFRPRNWHAWQCRARS